MYCQLEWMSGDGTTPGPPHHARRFVLHRHHDAEGPHLDLRLEQDGYLLGWRLDSAAAQGACWATEKPPHPLHWLDHDGDAVREDAGVYTWSAREADGGGELLLWGRAGLRRLCVRHEAGLPPNTVREVCRTLQEANAAAGDAAQLIEDGVLARQRAVERFVGLGCELDGAAFDVALWRNTLRAMPLQHIHQHLRAYEVRFDEKYPPRPVSQAEALPEENHASRLEAAAHILCG